MRTRASAKTALRAPSMKATATKPKAVAASTTNASWRRTPVRVIAYHAAANATTISGINTASRRRSASVLAIVATTTTAARRMAPRAATRCDIRGRVVVGVTSTARSDDSFTGHRQRRLRWCRRSPPRSRWPRGQRDDPRGDHRRSRTMVVALADPCGAFGLGVRVWCATRSCPTRRRATDSHTRRRGAPRRPHVHVRRFRRPQRQRMTRVVSLRG